MRVVGESDCLQQQRIGLEDVNENDVVEMNCENLAWVKLDHDRV